MLLLIRLTDPAAIDRIARRIIGRIEQPVRVVERECRVSASLGSTVSTFYRRPAAEQMLADADRALYASKAAGRAVHTFWPLADAAATPRAAPD